MTTAAKMTGSNVPAMLALADGAIFEGFAFGGVTAGETIGEVVFNTGMTGYQEALTDPSYAGQIVCLTYPLVGNYGVNLEDVESKQIQVAGFVVRELSSVYSNWRASESLDSFLARQNVLGIRGIDTRELTRRIRHEGVMMGAIGVGRTPDELRARLADTQSSYESVDWVRRVTTPAPYTWGPEPDEARYRVSVLDCGVKYNILRELATLGVRTTVFPATTTADELLADKPDGVFLSPGPGDPKLLNYAVETIRAIADMETPLMGICLGNQLLGCAFGGETYKLPFGHRGANHPVKDLGTGRVMVTSQNHGYALSADSLEGGDLDVTQINLNDGTVEGLRHRTLPIFSIQYHPEASPGPRDARSYFGEFCEMMDARRKRNGSRSPRD